MHDETIRKWCAAHSMAAVWDGPTRTLYDVYSGKQLRVGDAREVIERSASTGEEYLLIIMKDGRQLALAPAGIAWPPDFTNSGPLPGAPQVVCWRDFAGVSGQIDHVLAAHRDEPIGREVLDMLMYCIALVDGARAAGFDVGKEERRLEGFLAEIEKRRG